MNEQHQSLNTNTSRLGQQQQNQYQHQPQQSQLQQMQSQQLLELHELQQQQQQLHQHQQLQQQQIQQQNIQRCNFVITPLSGLACPGEVRARSASDCQANAAVSDLDLALRDGDDEGSDMDNILSDDFVSSLNILGIIATPPGTPRQGQDGREKSLTKLFGEGTIAASSSPPLPPPGGRDRSGSFSSASCASPKVSARKMSRD